MIKMRSRIGTIAVSLAALCFAAVPAMAQVPASNNGGTNNSNFGGVNNSNFNGFNGSGPAPNDAIYQQAKSLQTRLTAAQAAVRASNAANTPATGDGVRRFLRAGGTCNCCNCSATPEQAELQKVKAEAAAFLTEIKSKGNTAAFNPTW